MWYFFGKLSNLEADSADISATVMTVYNKTHIVYAVCAVILHIIGSNNN